ncbi:MAG: UDP-glucose 4-epimerase [Chlamydiia bacterium]|nr:UDP-glucose 4-epimerase [Chlamydiia bacterium]MCH9616414.1 UDP-glucose 4-epimerase [Chlamydiia bacterium]MCH9629600.1 UDP-glucose 4-epimerase [Chlamydiia bacterium]
MKKAVVTGGAGFIGSHMVDLLLEEGFNVLVIDNMMVGRSQNLAHHADNPHLEIREMDIRDLDAKSFEGVDYVFHFAGIGDIVPSIEKPKEYMSVNVQGTVCVLEAARAAKVKKFVYAASSSCYGLAATPTGEDAPIVPEHPYALSKYQGEMACFHWANVYGLPVNTIRIFNAYGTRSKTTGAYGAVMGVFLKQKLEGKPFTIVGDGMQKRDFVYVTDVAKAFYLAGVSDITGETFNLGAGNPQSVNYLAELLGGETVHLPKRPGEPDETHANNTKITKELGWKQTVSFEEGVAKVLENIEYWRSAPLWDEDSIAESTKTWFEFLKKGTPAC